MKSRKGILKTTHPALESSNASLASFTAYAAASPPPGSHVTMSVAGSLAGIDEALKRYALGMDHWRETMRSLKDAEEEVENIMREGDPVRCLSFFFLSCLIFCFFSFRVTRLIKA